MVTKMLVKKMNEIEMPKEMQERILKNCHMRMEEKEMRKNTPKKFFIRPVAAAACLALCICLTGVTALAATGKLQGFFKDITRWDGAVVGTSYEAAADEVELRVKAVSKELVLEWTMADPNTAPYSTFELLGVKNYKIVDLDGNVVVEGEMEEKARVADGRATTVISLENIPSGAYKLVVDELEGSAKADQPLVISGSWECEFVK